MNRNDKCSCGSGKKYKKCCLPKATVSRCDTCKQLKASEIVEGGHCPSCRYKAKQARIEAETDQLLTPPRQRSTRPTIHTAMIVAAILGGGRFR